MLFIRKTTVAMCIVVSLALMVMPCPGIAEMYSWTDADGVRHFSNNPPPKGTQAASSWKEIVSPQSATSKRPSDGSRPGQDGALDENETKVSVWETAASRQNIVEFVPLKARVAGGAVIEAKGLKVEYLRVGQKTQRHAKVAVMKETGSKSGVDGLLGMSFLRDFKHYVDMERKVIVWLK